MIESLKFKKIFFEVLIFLCIPVISLLYSGCASTSSFSGTGDLCGIVIDQNNQPVKGFLVFYKKNNRVIQTALTSDSGMFVFNGVPGGKCKISGEKENFVRLNDVEYDFCDRGKLFCCQIKTADFAFDNIDELLIRGEKQKALSVLNDICYESNSAVEATVLVYRFYLSSSVSEKTELVERLKKISNDSGFDFCDTADFLEEGINEA